MKYFVFILCAIVSCNIIMAQDANKIFQNACNKENAFEALDYLKENAENAQDIVQKRAIFVYLAKLQEQMGLYTDASTNYINAAAIGAKDAPNTGINPPEKLILDAVRCCLSSGDYETAISYLESSIQKSTDPTVRARINLYAVWANLSKAQDFSQVKDSVAVLTAYSYMNEMQTVKPQVLLTLWHLTLKDEYAKKLQEEFPQSIEASIVKGNVFLMPTPFWYFVPRSNDTTDITPIVTTKPTDTATIPTSQTQEIQYLQLGLFRSKDNATELYNSVKKAGFDPIIKSETRASGIVYFLVLVKDNFNHTMGQKLKESGYDNYLIK